MNPTLKLQPTKSSLPLNPNCNLPYGLSSTEPFYERLLEHFGLVTLHARKPQKHVPHLTREETGFAPALTGFELDDSGQVGAG